MSFRHRPDPEGSSRETATLILLTNRRHQSQNHQQRLLSSLHTRTRDTSDVDVSSDFSSLSEVDLYRGDPLSGDFSDYEMPLGGRWDLAAHWHLGDYSEGVEGDADDDDDEERDNDTDLSESTGRSRSIHLDLGRVQEILESSPSSTPIVVTRLPSFWNGIDISSSASEDIDSGHPATASSERTVRFNSREPQRAHTSSLSTLDNAHHSSGRETTLTLNLYTRGHDDIHPDTYHADMDDSQGDGDNARVPSRALTNNASGGHQNNTNLRNNSSTGSNGNYRVLRLAMVSEAVHSGSAMAHDVGGRMDPHGPRTSDQSARASGNHRIHTLQHSTLPSASREDRRSHYHHHHHHHHHHHALNSSSHGPRHSHSLSTSSPRGTLASYWSAMPRYQQHAASTSSLSSLSSSPVSSTSSSRVASPCPYLDLDTGFGANSHDNNTGSKPLDCEFATDEQHTGRGNCRETSSGGGDDNTAMNTGTTTTAIMTAALSSISALSTSNVIDSASTRRVISTTISSLPPFASTVFTPRTQSGVGPVGSSGLHRPLRPNHPRRQCCFLQPGQTFNGTQNLKTHTTTLSGTRARQSEEWDVKVVCSSCSQMLIVYSLQFLWDEYSR